MKTENILPVGCVAFCHVHDDGTALDGASLTPVASFNVTGVVRASTGIYEISVVSGVDLTKCAVALTYMATTSEDQGVLLCNNTVSTNTQEVYRLDINSTQENGPFTAAWFAAWPVNAGIKHGIAFDKIVSTYNGDNTVATETLYRNGAVVGVVTYTYSGGNQTQAVMTQASYTS